MEHNKHEDNYLHHLTCDIVVAYLSGNTIPFSDVPLLIQQIYRALAGVEMDVSDDKELGPAVPIKKSVFPDYIICLEDGKKVKMLKRHLMSAFGLTPSAYRKKWGLLANYPMVAPAYSEQRSRLARSSGLGNNKSQEITELQQEKSEEDAIVTRLPEVKRGRKGTSENGMVFPDK